MPIAYVSESNIWYEEYYGKMNIAQKGKPKPKPKYVLFIHGLGSSSLAWRDIPAALSDISTMKNEYFHTINIDLIDFGKSDKPQTGNYTMKGFAEFIINFIWGKELELQKMRRYP
jgi:pimeloyl-ACP methyl ester carboxylesterase